MTAQYVYGVIPSGDEIIFDVAGLDDDDVYTVPHTGVAAVIGASPRPDYQGLQREEAARYLVVHQRVIEVVMHDFPILPVKFGTVLSDETWVHRLLEQNKDRFLGALETFADRQQLEVVVLWDVQQVFEAIGQEEAIVRLKAQIADKPPEETMAERIAIGQQVKASLERRRATLRDRLIPPLREVALDVVVNPVMDDNMVANLALLVDQAGNGALDEQLEALDEAFDGRFTFRCVGPLPPYSFATVEVQVPSFEEVDEARRRLGLAETATPGEIKQAYRHLAGQLHPDHNPEDPEAETRMAELAQAYRLLTAYAESMQEGRGAEEQGAPRAGKRPAPHDAPLPPCTFSREAVDQTLLVDIRRQEAPAQEPPQV